MKKIIVAMLFAAFAFAANAQHPGTDTYYPSMMFWGQMSYSVNAREDSIARAELFSIEGIEHGTEVPRFILTLRDSTIITSNLSKNAVGNVWSAARNGKTIQLDGRIGTVTFWFIGNGYELLRRNRNPNSKPGDRNIIYFNQTSTNTNGSQQKPPKSPKGN